MPRPRDSDESPEPWEEDGYVDIGAVVRHLEISEELFPNPNPSEENDEEQ